MMNIKLLELVIPPSIYHKENKERSATEQAADLAKFFKIMPEMKQTITARNIIHDRHPIKCTIHNSLQKISN